MGNLRAKAEGEPRKPIPAGNYFGIIIGVFDIGTQSGGMYGPKHQIIVRWELHKRRGPVRDEAGNISTIANFYSLSFADLASLRKDVESMLGRKFTHEEAKAGYDVEQLLGKPCRLQIVHDTKADGTIRDMIGTIMPLDEDDDVPKAESDEVYFEIGADRFISDKVPEWVAKIIRRSTEFGGGGEKVGVGAATGGYGTVGNGKQARTLDDDDIPF